MRSVYAHDAVLRMAGADDPSAVGAAITVALCGHWDHEPPCPLAPHATRADRNGSEVRVRTLFAVEPEREGEVRRRIDDALATGRQETPEGSTSRWQLVTSAPAAVLDSEHEHGERLIRS
jgi:hypothetical protein